MASCVAVSRVATRAGPAGNEAAGSFVAVLAPHCGAAAICGPDTDTA